jgi:hypothetical protein
MPKKLEKDYASDLRKIVGQIKGSFIVELKKAKGKTFTIKQFEESQIRFFKKIMKGESFFSRISDGTKGTPDYVNFQNIDMYVAIGFGNNLYLVEVADIIRRPSWTEEDIIKLNESKSKTGINKR